MKKYIWSIAAGIMVVGTIAFVACNKDIHPTQNNSDIMISATKDIPIPNIRVTLDLGRKDSTGTCKPQWGICDFHISITFDDLDKPKDPVLAMPETYHDLMTMHVDYSNADTTEKNFIHDNLMKDSGLIYLSSRVLVDDADVLDYLHLCNPILFKPQNAIVQHVDLANEQFDVILRFKNMKRMADGTLSENDTEDI